MGNDDRFGGFIRSLSPGISSEITAEQVIAAFQEALEAPDSYKKSALSQAHRLKEKFLAQKQEIEDLLKYRKENL